MASWVLSSGPARLTGARPGEMLGEAWSEHGEWSRCLETDRLNGGARRRSTIERVRAQEPIRTPTSGGMTTSDRTSDHAAYQAICRRIRQGACAPGRSLFEPLGTGESRDSARVGRREQRRQASQKVVLPSIPTSISCRRRLSGGQAGPGVHPRLDREPERVPRARHA